MEPRTRLLAALLAEPLKAEELSRSLSHLKWDSDDELVDLHRAHVSHALSAYMQGELDASEIETWANAVEGRDDIGREEGFELLLNDAIHCLANPVLEGHLSEILAQRWLVRLGR